MDKVAQTVEQLRAIIGTKNEWGLVRKISRLQLQKKREKKDFLWLGRQVEHLRHKVERIIPPASEPQRAEDRRWPFLRSEEP